jgi:hypothetical protein
MKSGGIEGRGPGVLLTTITNRNLEGLWILC